MSWALKIILPTVENGYKSLTTDKEQRDSFRNHIIAASKNALVPVDANKEGAKENLIYDLSDLLAEKVQVSLEDEEGEAEEVSGDFIDIEPAEEDVLDDFGISGEDATGRNFAQKTFERIETLVSASLKILQSTKISLSASFGITFS